MKTTYMSNTMTNDRFRSFKSPDTSGSPCYELQPVKCCNSFFWLSVSPRTYIREVRPHGKTPCQRNNCVASIMKFSEDKDILEIRGLIVDDPNFENLMQNMEYIAWFYQVSLDEESSKLTNFIPGKILLLQNVLWYEFSPGSLLEADYKNVSLICLVWKSSEMIFFMARPTLKPLLITIRMWFAYSNEPNTSTWDSTRAKSSFDKEKFNLWAIWFQGMDLNR